MTVMQRSRQRRICDSSRERGKNAPHRPGHCRYGKNPLPSFQEHHVRASSLRRHEVTDGAEVGVGVYEHDVVVAGAGDGERRSLSVEATVS